MVPGLMCIASGTSALLLNTHFTHLTLFPESAGTKNIDQLLSELTNSILQDDATLSNIKIDLRLSFILWRTVFTVYSTPVASFTAPYGWPCYGCCPFGCTYQLFKTALCSPSLNPTLTSSTQCRLVLTQMHAIPMLSFIHSISWH